MKKASVLLCGVLTALLALLAALLVGPRLFGLRAYLVMSGSMEPTYPTGSVLYVKKADISALKVGDAITFWSEEYGVIVTHRIVEMLDGPRYRTQGDANNVADTGSVAAQDVLGTPVFAIPYLGYGLNALRTSPGRYVALAVCLGVMAWGLVPALLPRKKDGEV